MPTSVSFRASNVKPSEVRFKGTSLEASFKALLGKKLPEASGANAANLIPSIGINSFVYATHVAFDQHLPLALSPDDVWLCIAQGFAAHVNAHAEELRKQFVKHEGKEVIRVIRNTFVKGSPTNDWPGAFAEFSDQIEKHIGKKRDLIVANFSTTGPVEKAASEIVLMDAMQAYFDYRMRTSCGIPSITLLGEVSDWRSIRERASVLSEFGCEEWINALLPVIDKFLGVYDGAIDLAFWESFYKQGGGSGGPFVTGAINVFFPYLASGRANSSVSGWNRHVGFMCGGPNPTDLPIGLSKAPFIWEYHGAELPMEFLGGFVGVSQEGDQGTVRPAIGWAVREAEGAK